MECCNTPDVIYPICTPTLAISGLKLFYFLGFGFLSPCVVLVVMHLISCHHVHCICIHVRLMHSSIFPRCPFCIPALRSPPVVISTFLSCVGIKHFRIGPRLAKRPWFTTVDRLSSFVPFGLRLMLQRLTRDQEGLVCVAAQHPSKLAQNPPKPSPSSRAFDHDRVAENRTSFGLS